MQLSYAMMAYMKYANAPSKFQCEFLQHNVRRRVNVLQMRGESPPFKEKRMKEIKRQKDLINGGARKKKQSVCTRILQ